MLNDLTQANLFELAGDFVQVSFGSTNILGGPTLSYRDQTTSQAFRGNAIAIEETVLGQEITVTLENVPDLRIVTFTLVLPEVTVMQQSAGTCIQTFGVKVANPMSIAGPLPGPQKLYRVTPLSGTAQFIVS
ncbi:MAG: hypothetical protein AAGC93_12850 [Cyanobacteria bacterium P01_F01_bin.53]